MKECREKINNNVCLEIFHYLSGDIYDGEWNEGNLNGYGNNLNINRDI